MKRLLIATKNEGKFNELRTFLSHLPLGIVSLSDLDIKADIDENGKTYAENSKKKALFFAKLSGLPTIADDAGLEIDALGGAPGVKTRRWLGKRSTDKELAAYVKKISKALPDDNRTAYFKAVITFAMPDGRFFQESGEVEGIISKNIHLKLLKGYPFRSFFYLPEIKKYFHENELSENEQKLYNHRYKAIVGLKPIITKILGLKDYSDKSV